MRDKEGQAVPMRCERCGRPAGPGNGTTCRYCGGALVADDPMQAYGIANPHAPRPRAKRPSRGGGILRAIGYVGAVILTIAIIVAVRVGLRTIFDSFSSTGTSTIGASATTFTDPLTSNVFRWADDDNAFFRSDGYHVVSSVIVYAPVEPQQAVDASVRVVQIKGGVTWNYGMGFRIAKNGDGYVFRINSDGMWGFAKVVNGEITRIIDPDSNDAIQRGLNAVNTLEVKADGSHYIFLVNGTQVGEADDSTFTGRGQVGLLGHDNIEVVFNHLSMKWHN